MTANDWIAIAACGIALASFFVAATQTKLSREHNKLSVRPLLVIYRKEFANHPVEYVLENCGLGPAVLKGFEVYVDDVPVGSMEPNPLYAALNKLSVPKDGVGGHIPAIGEALPAGRNISMLKFSNTPSDPLFHKGLVLLLPRLKFRVRYASIYDEPFELFGNGSQPTA